MRNTGVSLSAAAIPIRAPRGRRRNTPQKSATMSRARKTLIWPRLIPTRSGLECATSTKTPNATRTLSAMRGGAKRCRLSRITYQRAISEQTAQIPCSGLIASHAKRREEQRGRGWISKRQAQCPDPKCVQVGSVQHRHTAVAIHTEVDLIVTERLRHEGPTLEADDDDQREHHRTARRVGPTRHADRTGLKEIGSHSRADYVDRRGRYGARRRRSRRR